MGSSRDGPTQHCPGLGLKWTPLAAQFLGEKHSHGGLRFRNPACLSPLPLQQTSPPKPFPVLLCFFHLTLMAFVVLHLTF